LKTVALLYSRDLEDHFSNLAQLGDGEGKAVVLCDRGTLDIKSTLSSEEWEILL